jgi:hypothetical protein
MNILSETPNEVLLGRDSGLFACRVSIAVRSVDKQRRQVTITTHIRNRNLLGRLWTADRRAVPSQGSCRACCRA